MIFLPRSYLEVLRERNFFILAQTLLFGQMATGFLLISLISSVFAQTGSNFGVSGIVLSLFVPSFLLMILAGLFADLVDRKKLIIGANLAIAFVVLLILLTLNTVFASISFSFLYFAGNTFFFPAVSAASAQIVKKSQLTVANSVFISIQVGGQVVGLFVGALTLFIFGELTTLVVCESLLIIAVILPLFLPSLVPKKMLELTILMRVREILGAFVYIFKAKITRFFFLTLAFSQAIIAFGVTLGPGFFDEVVHLTIRRSPLFILPLVAVGTILGTFWVHKSEGRERSLVESGFVIMGLATAILGLAVKLSSGDLLILLPVGLFIIFVVFGDIVAMTASRVVLQKSVSHSLLGTIFGANIMFSSLIASILSPLAATLELLFGYVNIFIFGGLIFLLMSLFIAWFGKRWKF